MNRSWLILIAIALFIGGFNLGGGFDPYPQNMTVSISEAKAQPSKAGSFTPIKPGDPLPANAFIELAKAVNPAVVNISTTVKPRRGGPRDPLFDMLEQFYGFRAMPQMQRPSTALGTGFIIRNTGLIITNNHVIEGADVINVQLSDKSEKLYEAKVIGSDERTDIALIKIEGKDFPTLSFGSSGSTEVGEWVAAFGNPFGNGHTMTKGIISAKGRDISEINRFPLMQTDAPINPGNSGGPLVNLRGEVIGVNSAIDARAQGIGFAIPIDEVKTILPQIERNEKVKKGFLGVTMKDLTPQDQLALGLPEDIEGAFIASVEDDGPAAKAGIQPYDIITDFNGRKIKSTMDLGRAVTDSTVGSQAKVKLNREGKEKTITVTVAERDEGRLKKVMKRGAGRIEGEEAPFELGFRVLNFPDVPAAFRQECQIPADVRKPVVVAVDEKSPAAKAGLLPGDLILDVNRKEIKTVKDLMKDIKKGTNTLRVFRDGTILFIIIKV
jgi:serine protease Do